MKEYMLKGDPAEVEKVIRENRIRISRGVISITPAEPGASEDADSLETLSESLEISHKECDRLSNSLFELSELTRNIVLIAVEAGEKTIPDTLKASLAEYGIIVPKIEETANILEVDGEKTPESVTNNMETVLKESETSASELSNETAEKIDDKNIYAEDFKEVDLDADSKDDMPEDTKEPPGEDVKEVPTPKKTSSRKNKPE